jgi:thiol-disulfide isomerase/thioredoxin
MKSFRFSFLFLFFLIQCAPQSPPNLGIETWVLEDESGNTFHLPEREWEHLALNFYSQTCMPCIREIPALNWASEQLTNPNHKIWMVVDPTGIAGEDDFQKAMPIAKEIMKQEVSKRGIKLPIFFIHPPFEVKQSGLVTGTPETLIFKKNPFQLFYNFIGPISEAESIASLEKDSKMKFFLRIMGEGL